MVKIYTTEKDLVYDEEKGALVEKPVKRYLADVPAAAKDDAIIRFGRIYRDVKSE